MQNVLISGNSSGLGLAFTEHYLQEGSRVLGFSRRGCPLQHERLSDIQCDLAELEQITGSLQALLADVTQLDLIILNAGVLGEIRDLQTTSLQDIHSMMDINVWANKVLLDFLLDNGIHVKQIVFISSGAAVNGNKGWGAYSLSKATLNMLAMLYAHEMPNTHISALAPGLVDTAMQDQLCNPNVTDAELYPSLKKLRAARGTENMPTPKQAALIITKAFKELLSSDSGRFHDVRTMKI